MEIEIKILPKAKNDIDRKLIQDCLERKHIWSCRGCSGLCCELVKPLP
jgi:hypothetical protein